MTTFLLVIAVFSAGDGEWPVLWPILPPVISAPTSNLVIPLIDETSDEAIDETQRVGVGDIIIPDGEYAAPIPDSLITHNLIDEAGNEVQIILKKPAPKKELERLPGSTHAWPHMGCNMCLGNHLITSHGQSANYLHSITYAQWKVLHDNLHNSKSFVGVKGSGEGYIGYEAGVRVRSYRRGLFGRRR